jgi:hypothetical protein
MRKLLIKLHIVQVKKIEHGFKRYRLNPWNPLSYIAIVIGALVGVFMFGFVGIFNEVDNRNHFKWQ